MGWEGGIAAMAVSVAVASCGNRGLAPTSFTGSSVEGQSCSEVGYSCNQTGITLQSPNDHSPATARSDAIVHHCPGPCAGRCG